MDLHTNKLSDWVSETLEELEKENRVREPRLIDEVDFTDHCNYDEDETDLDSIEVLYIHCCEFIDGVREIMEKYGFRDDIAHFWEQSEKRNNFDLVYEINWAWREANYDILTEEAIIGAMCRGMYEFVSRSEMLELAGVYSGGRPKYGWDEITPDWLCVKYNDRGYDMNANLEWLDEAVGEALEKQRSGKTAYFRHVEATYEVPLHEAITDEKLDELVASINKHILGRNDVTNGNATVALAKTEDGKDAVKIDVAFDDIVPRRKSLLQAIGDYRKGKINIDYFMHGSERRNNILASHIGDVFDRCDIAYTLPAVLDNRTESAEAFVDKVIAIRNKGAERA